MLSYRRETALQGTLVLAKSGRLELRDDNLRANECLTTLSLAVFAQRNFVADFLQVKSMLDRKHQFCVLRPPPGGGLGATYDDHLRFIGKRLEDFLLVLIEYLSLGVTAEALRPNIGSKSAISLQLIIKIVATRCMILRLQCTKIDISAGAACVPDPASKLTALPAP